MNKKTELIQELENMMYSPSVNAPEKREAAQRGFSLGALTFSAKLFISLMLGVAGLCYAALLGSIWVDTEMKMAYIIEGYGMMEAMELVAHTFKYLFWFFGIFSVSVGLLLCTAYSEKVKTFFAAFVPFMICLDLGSAWLVRVHDLFAYVLFGSGLVLAISFLAVFVLIQLDLWSRKTPLRNI